MDFDGLYSHTDLFTTTTPRRACCCSHRLRHRGAAPPLPGSVGPEHSNLTPETAAPDKPANEAFPGARIRPTDSHLLRPPGSEHREGKPFPSTAHQDSRAGRGELCFIFILSFLTENRDWMSWTHCLALRLASLASIGTPTNCLFLFLASEWKRSGLP